MKHLTVAMALALAAGLHSRAQPAGQSSSGAGAPLAQADRCDNSDGAWNTASFVVVTEPAPGTRVDPGFVVRGCSRTFESNVTWRLVARDGSTMAEGHTTGGGVDGPGAFRFTVDYTIDTRQLAHLEVNEPVVTETEGFPPTRNVIPLVLRPVPGAVARGGGGGAAMIPTGEWTLESLEGEPVKLEQPITLRLDDNGRVSGIAGCNRYFTSAEWTGDGARLVLGPVGSTRMYCPETAEIEQRYLGALSKVAGARRAGNHLDLTDDDGKVLLRFGGPSR